MYMKLFNRLNKSLKISLCTSLITLLTGLTCMSYGAINEVKVQVTPVVLGEYLLTNDNDLAIKDVNLVEYYGNPWYVDISVTDTNAIKSELTKLAGKPRSQGNVDIWFNDKFFYQVGSKRNMTDFNKRAAIIGKEKVKKEPNVPGNNLLRVIRIDVEQMERPLQAVNTERIGNTSMGSKAVVVDDNGSSQRSGGSLLDRITSGGDGYTGCPPGKVWVGPRTAEDGTYIPGRCVDPSTLER